MKLRVTLAALVASMAICSQSFGFDLLDKMLSKSGCGCASSCCATPVGPSCGADNSCGGLGGCGGMIGPSCGADNGCGGLGMGGCGGCRKKLLDFNVRCISLPVIVPKINLPKIHLPKLNRCCGNGGCAAFDPCSGAGNGCGCGNVDPSCGADNGCGGCGNGCGGAIDPSCGADNGCAAASCGCARACRVGLLDRIRSRMACHRACFRGCADMGCGCAAGPSCGADNGCGCGAADPSCGADNGCGCSSAYAAPAAAPAAAPVAAPVAPAVETPVAPPAPVVDPHAFNKARRGTVVQTSLSDR